MKNDSTIRKALAQAIPQFDRRKVGIAMAVGASASTIGRIEDETARGQRDIDDELWDLLYPILLKYGDLPCTPYYMSRAHLRSMESIHSQGSKLHDGDLRDKLKPESVAMAWRWQHLCPLQQGEVLGFMRRVEDEAAQKKDRDSASCKSA